MKRLKFWSMILLMAMSLPLMVSCGGDDSDDETSAPPSEYPDNPDPFDVMNFKDLQVTAICVANFDLNKDGKITYAEAAAVKDIGEHFRKSNIESFHEFKYFTGLSTIPFCAFARCTALSSITLPNGVKTIDKGAFENCNSLISIVIPNSVTTIEDHSFLCEKLSSIVIGTGLTTINGNAISQNSLTSIKVESGNPKYDSRENCNALIETATNEIILGSGRTIIPNSVTSIGKAAFHVCSILTSITIPNSVTSIRDRAFYGCSGLTSVTIPNSVKGIGNRAFYYCSGLTSVTIGSGVTSIGSQAFDGVDIPTVISLIENPFKITGKTSDSRTFSQNTFNNATLYVPVGTIDKYKATEGWKDFVSIVEGTPTGIKVIENTQKRMLLSTP